MTKRELIDQAYADYNRGDFLQTDRWQPDGEWDFTHFEGWPGTQVYQGVDDIVGALEDWTSGFEEYFAAIEEIHECPDGRVVVLCRQGGRSHGAPMFAEISWAQIWTIRDGRIARVENWSDREAALRAVGLA